MSGENQVRIQTGIPPEYREAAAALYDEAFGPKLAVAVPNAAQRRRLLAASFDLRHAIVALSEDELVGLAGFHSADGSLTGGLTAGGLLDLLGFVGGTRAIAVLSLYQRRPVPDELLMDGLAVRADRRGGGLGTRLLQAIKVYAVEAGYTRVRLDVIDTNEAARRLYEREGFVPVKTESFELLRNLLGFGASTMMVWTA